MNNIQDLKELKEVLQSEIEQSNQVIIVPHDLPDYDALGSAVGLVNVCNKLSCPAYILIDDEVSKMSKSIRGMILEIKEEYKVINLTKYLKQCTNKDLLIMTDVNNGQLLSVQEQMDKFYESIIIDHHVPNNHTVKSDYRYINPEMSSTSEIVATLLHAMRIKYNSRCANYLYAGIYLDTKHLSAHMTENTFSTANRLVKKGADFSYINGLFFDDFEADRKIQELVGFTSFQTYSYAIACGQNKFYTKEELAKTADYIMKYKVDAAFAVGLMDQSTIGISARSNGNIDVSLIMTTFGGGGHLMSAASIIKNSNIDVVESTLRKVLAPGK